MTEYKIQSMDDLARLIHEGLGRGGASWFGGLDARGVAASVSPLELVLV